MRIPRKKKKQIPTGMYCYQATSGWKILKNGQYGFTTKLCPFYEKKYEGVFGGHCKLLDAEIIDQCKSCGLKYGF